MVDSPRVFALSFEEHAWMEKLSALDGAAWVDAANGEILRRVSVDAWQSANDEQLDVIDDDLDPTDPSAFVAYVRETLREDGGIEAPVVDAVAASLEALLAKRGATLVSGGVMTFEGHHNDTEIVVEIMR